MSFWKDNPSKLEYLIKWYPHFGASKIAKEFGLTRQQVQQKALILGLRLLAQTERICYYCRKNKCRMNRGNRCHECMRPKWNEYTAKSVNKDPLIQRFKNCLAAAKKRAKQKNKDFDIDLNFLLELWKKQNGKCFYSGIDLKAHNYGEGYRHQDSISLDRINCHLGYTRDNVVLCSYYANLAKSELSKTEFLNMCKLIVEYNNV